MVFGFSIAPSLCLCDCVCTKIHHSVCTVFAPCESLIWFGIASKCAVNSISNQQCLCDLQWGWCGSCHCFSFFFRCCRRRLLRLSVIVVSAVTLFSLSYCSAWSFRVVRNAHCDLCSFFSLTLSTPLLDVWHVTIHSLLCEYIHYELHNQNILWICASISLVIYGLGLIRVIENGRRCRSSPYLPLALSSSSSVAAAALFCECFSLY